MTTGTPITAPAPSTGSHACPQCNGNLLRTWRRPIDRFLSRFMPVHRYRCDSFQCQWEGNFRIDRGAFSIDGTASGDTDTAALGLQEDAHPPTVPRSFVVHMVLAVAGALFVVIFTTTDWSLDRELANNDPRDDQWLASANLVVRGTQSELPRQPPTAVQPTVTVARTP